MADYKSLLYLQRDKFDYYDQNLAQILPFNFSSELVKDLEIVNPASFHLQIKSFTDNNKIAPSQMMIVLSASVYFEKEFPETSEFHKDNELSKFVDTIPFENCITKIYKIDGSSKLIATNADLYNVVKDAFEEAGFVVETIVPICVLGKDVITSELLDVTTAKNILARYDLAKQNSLAVPHSGHSKPQDQSVEKNKKENNKSLIFLLPILFILIIVLVILYIKTLV